MSFCGGWGMQSHVQPNNCVEVVLRCVVVGIVTIKLPNIKQVSYTILDNYLRVSYNYLGLSIFDYHINLILS